MYSKFLCFLFLLQGARILKLQYVIPLRDGIAVAPSSGEPVCVTGWEPQLILLYSIM